MATCDVCAAEEVAFIVGDANTGAQQFLGPGCMARFGLELAKALLDPAELRDAAREAEATADQDNAAADGEQTPEPEPQDEPPAQNGSQEAPEGRRSRKSKSEAKEPQPAQGPSGGPAETSPTASDS